MFNFTLDGESFSIHSAGLISLHSGDSDGSNVPGGDIILKGGDVLNSHDANGKIEIRLKFTIFSIVTRQLLMFQ